MSISIYEIFSQSSITEKQNVDLTDLGLSHRDLKSAKILLTIIYGNDIIERNIIEFRGIIELLKNSSDPMRVLQKVNELTGGQNGEVTGEWKRKILTEFVCEFFGNKSCTTYGRKISNSLIRVAATRIFADPEQSIMELPVNSIDSYNLLKGKKSVGKFGMGFFSIFYWLSESYAGEYKRFMELRTRYRVEEGFESYKAIIRWTTDGLLIEKQELEPDYEFNMIKDTTGTEIKINFAEQKLSTSIVNKMKSFVDRLVFIEGADLILNGRKLNEYESNEVVNIIINKDIVSITDNAAGIPFTILENSLLVPSSSTKERDLEIDVYKEPSITQSFIYESYFNIIVNGVIIIKVIHCGKYDINIHLPYNSKLPVSRDDVIYGKYEIDFFYKSCFEVTAKLIKLNNVVSIFNAIEKYTLINKSLLLVSALKKLREEIEKSPYVLLPNLRFWEDFINKSSPSIKPFFVLYDNPDMYVTERKLLAGLKYDSKVFKLRNIIYIDMKTPCENGGLSSILFISDKYKDKLSTIQQSNTTTLLIPYEEEYEIDLSYISNCSFDIDYNRFNKFLGYTANHIFGMDVRLRKDSYDLNFFNTLKIVQLCYYRKFENFHYGSYKNIFVEFFVTFYYVFIRLSIDVNVLISYMIKINSILMNHDIKTRYGTTNLIQFNDIESSSSSLTYNSFSFPSSVDLTHRIKVYEVNTPECIKVIHDTIKFFIEIIDNDTLSNNILTLPSYNTIILNFNANTIFKNSISSHLKNLIYNELKVAINNTITPSETWYMIKTFKYIFSEDINLKDLKFDGLGMFILDELRKKTSNHGLLKYAKESLHSTNSEIHSKIFRPLVEAGKSYLRFISNTSKYIPPTLSGGVEFYVKQLIEYVFNNEVRTTNTDLFISLSQEKDTYVRSERKLQILEIAVNEGTTKGFIQSVLTELVQNSTDAIRLIEGNGNVSVIVTRRTISVRDEIGFDNLINIMIPFLSSKNPNDPRVTGEMGSGFFNIYRQPFCDFVTVITTKDKIRRTLKATPLVENGNVYDILFQVNEERVESDNGSEVTLHMKDSLEMNALLVAEATIFTNSYLSFIPEIMLNFNGGLVQKQFDLSFSSNDDSVNFYIVYDISTVSYVMTNGIPLMPLENFINSFEYDDDDNYSIWHIFDRYCRTSIILNISKDIYTPTQSRSKVQFKPTLNMREFKKKLYDGIYFTLLKMYLSQTFSLYHQNIIQFSEEMSDPRQLNISNNDILKSFVSHYTSEFRIDEEISKAKFNSINDALRSYATNIDKPPLINSTDIRYLSVVKWFNNKNYPPARKQEEEGEPKKPKEPSTPWPVLQKFMDIYWIKILEMSRTGVLISQRFNRNGSIPGIYHKKMSISKHGFYDPNDHVIILNSLHYNEAELSEALEKYKGKDMEKIFTKFTTDPVLKKYFSPCIPTRTLIHEIAHAIDGQSHQNSGHGTTQIKIRDSNFLEFENLASECFREAIIMGLLKEFLASL